MLDLFYYSFLDKKLVGSEDPGLYGNPYALVEELCEQYDIRHMITLTPEFSEYNIIGLSQYHVPIYQIPSRQDMRQLFEIIDSSLQKNDAVLIHCRAGIDRTGCVIGAYLAQKGHDTEQIIDELLSKFKNRFNNPNLNDLWKDKADFIRSYSK